jgi:hypothetical protein
VHGAEGPGPRDPEDRRPSIDERAARRVQLGSPERDRYDALLRHLQAGREIAVQPRPRRSLGIQIDASAGRILLAAAVVLVVWFAAIAITDQIRQRTVDTWTGPDASVQSGLRLEGCPDIVFREDVYFPSWVRFEGRIFRWADLLAPIGPNSVGVSFLSTGYRNGDLELFRVLNDPEGRAGNKIMLRQGDSPAGAIYVAADCG